MSTSQSLRFQASIKQASRDGLWAELGPIYKASIERILEPRLNLV